MKHTETAEDITKLATDVATKVATDVAADVAKATVLATEKHPSKAAVAREIFVRMRTHPRKEVVQAFINEAGLTYAGAGTYYQNFRKAQL
jgi:hypothetical protein